MSLLRLSLGAGLLLLQAFCAPALALRRAEKYLSTPEMGKLVYEDVRIPTTDGQSLHGWFLPFQDQQGTGFSDPKPIVVMVTDGTDNMGSLLWHYFNFFRGAPWHVLVFDWRGMGSSSRWAPDTTHVVIPEQIVDLRAAIDFAKDRPEFDGKHLGLFGYDAGAAVVLAAAAEREDIQAVVIRGVYTTQAALCARRRTARPCTPHPGWPPESEPIRAVSRLRAPVLIVVGESDAITPPEMAQAVHEAHTGPKQLWVAPKAGHEGFEAPEVVHMKPFRVKLHGFLGRHLGRE